MTRKGRRAIMLIGLPITAAVLSALMAPTFHNPPAQTFLIGLVLGLIYGVILCAVAEA